MAMGKSSCSCGDFKGDLSEVGSGGGDFSRQEVKKTNKNETPAKNRTSWRGSRMAEIYPQWRPKCKPQAFGFSGSRNPQHNWVFCLNLNPCRLTPLGSTAIVLDSEEESALAKAHRFLFREKRFYEFRTHYNAGPAGA
jgi:hypothetical protein